MKSDANTAITVGTNTLNDTLGNTEATSTISGFRSVSDTLSNGTISFTMNSTPEAITVNNGMTVQNLVDQINTGVGHNQVDPYGVHAAYANGSITMTSDTYGAAGNFVTPTTNVADTMTGVGLSYTANSAYNVGISNSTGANALFDSSTQSAPVRSQRGLLELRFQYRRRKRRRHHQLLGWRRSEPERNRSVQPDRCAGQR